MEARKPDVLMIDLPTPMKDSVMFGPEWTYEALMPAASYPSNSQIPRAELIDIHNGWIGRVRSVAAQVTVPVESRQGQFDALWINGCAAGAVRDAWPTGLPASVFDPRSDGRLPPESLSGAAKIWGWPQIAGGAPSLKMV